MPNEKKMLTRDDILAADDLKIKIEDVPEWGGSVGVRMMSGFERDEFEAEISKRSPGLDAEGKPLAGRIDMKGVKALLVSLTVVGDDGKPMFTTADIPALNGKAAAPIDRLFEVASKLNGIGDKAVKELMGNSKGAPSGAAGSPSPDK